MLRWTLLAAVILFCPMALLQAQSPPVLSDLPENAVLIELANGAKRLSNQTHVFTLVPPQLQGLTALIPHRGSSTSEPGPGYRVTLNQPMALYLAVHHRGTPTIPDSWKPTGLTIGWGGHEDNVYVRLADPGPVEIPAHDGRAGGFGVPHMLIVSHDLEQARQLMNQPVPRRSAIHRPARVAVVLPDPKQPGLYGHPGDTIRWQLRVIPGSDPTLPSALNVKLQELDGPFTWSAIVPVDSRGHTEVLAVKPPNIGYFDLDITAQYADGCKDEVIVFLGGLGIVPQPDPVDKASPWGVMRVAEAPFEAKLARMLGASWVRHTNWNMVTPKPQGVEPGKFRALAQAYRDQGLHVMASISLVPQPLSSQPDNASTSGDAGPLYSRVAPRDWNQWQQFMQDTASSVGDLIDYWEIGNEPNTPHHYWAGSVEEFTDLLKHAALGIRAGDPGATILTAGFTLDPSARGFFDRMLALGAGQYFDILTVHSLYAKAVSVEDMRAVLAKHGLPADMPVWSTEPKHVLPMRNFAAGVQKNMHFLLVNPGAYASFQNLSERDGAAAPWGVAYALAAKHLGTASFQKLIHTGLPDVELGMFDRGGQVILVATADQGPRGSGVRVQVQASGTQSPRYVDLFGHEREVPAQGSFIMPLDRSGILHGATVLEIEEIMVGDSSDQPQGLEIGADQATLKNGFILKSDEARGPYAVVYRSPAQAGSNKPAVSFPFTLEAAGTYEFYVSAMWYPSHAGALVSPFQWSIDNRPAQLAPADATVHWRRSTRTNLRFGQVDPSKDANITAVQTFARLGTVRRLTPGTHTITLELQAPRAHDGHFSMEVQMVAMRPIVDDGE